MNRPMNHNTPALNVPSPYKFTPEVQRLALDMISETGNRQAACDAAGINVSTFNRLLRKDPTFKECFKEAQHRFVAKLESLAFDLARGTIHRKPGPGGIMYDEVKHHPTVLLALLRRHDPSNWGDKKTIDHNHNHNQQIGLDKLTQEQRDQLRDIILSQMEPAKEIAVDIGPAKAVESGGDARPADEPQTDMP